MSALRKLSWARSLLSAHDDVQTKPEISDSERFHYQQAALRYRNLIIDGDNRLLSAIDPYTPVATAQKLADHLASLKADGAPDEDVYAAVLHAEKIKSHLARAARYGDSDAWVDAQKELDQHLVLPGSVLQQVYKDTLEESRLDDETQAEAEAAIAATKDVRGKIDALRRKNQDDAKALSQIPNAIVKDMNAFVKQGGSTLSPEYRALQQQYNSARDMAENQLKEVNKQFKKEVEALQQEAEAPLITIGQNVTQFALSRSPITQKQADAWTATLGIDQDKSLKAKLKRIDYPVERFKADVAEFYRLNGGKIAKIRFNVERGSRASAEGIESAGHGVVNVKGEFNKRVLFHEMAHHLESDPVAKKLSNVFIAQRRTSDKTQSLRKLTGKDYDSHERAWPDDFLDPYVGKEYSDGVTEVTSIGFEHFSDPARLARAIAKDPEHIGLMMGYAAMPDSPLYQGLKHLVNESKEARDAAAKQKAIKLNALLERIDQLMPMEKAPEPNLSPMDKKHAKLTTYLGSLEGWAIYKAKRNYINGVKKLSPCLVAINRNRFADTEIIHSTDLRAAKVAVAYNQQQGIWPRSVHEDVGALSKIIETLEKEAANG